MSNLELTQREALFLEASLQWAQRAGHPTGLSEGEDLLQAVLTKIEASVRTQDREEPLVVDIKTMGELTIESIVEAVHHLEGKFRVRCNDIRVSSVDYRRLTTMPATPACRFVFSMKALSVLGMTVTEDVRLPHDELWVFFRHGAARVRRALAQQLEAARSCGNCFYCDNVEERPEVCRYALATEGNAGPCARWKELGR